MRLSTPGAVALGVAALLAALSFVTWRQARVLEALAEVDRLQRELSLVEAERGELSRSLQFLETRGRVVPEAREQLGMRSPEASEIVILPGGGP